MAIPPEKESHLSQYVTPDRLSQQERILSDANMLQTAAILIQGLALGVFYLLFSQFSFWTLLPEAAFLTVGALSLYLSSTHNPSENNLNTSLRITKIVLAASLVGLVVGLATSNAAFDFAFLIPGPTLSALSFIARKIPAREIKLRIERGGPVGVYGNLKGTMANLTAYGVDPSTRIRVKNVATGILFFEGLTTSAILRANTYSTHSLGLGSNLFWISLLGAVAITAVVGSVISVGLELIRTRWNQEVTGTVALDTLENSNLWYHGKNHGLERYRLFDRPMVSIEDNQRLVVAHYPGSFEIKPVSPSDFTLLTSVFNDKTNYSELGRRVSSHA